MGFTDKQGGGCTFEDIHNTHGFLMLSVDFGGGTRVKMYNHIVPSEPNEKNELFLTFVKMSIKNEDCFLCWNKSSEHAR